jgi:hypothetical protein
VRVSFGEGGTRIPEAFMTSTTFLSDSGTASYCKASINDIHGVKKRAETYKLVPLVGMHEAIEQI